MGGGELPHIPDWRTYTVGEHTPELLKTQRMLKSLGLKVFVVRKPPPSPHKNTLHLIPW